MSDPVAQMTLTLTAAQIANVVNVLAAVFKPLDLTFMLPRRLGRAMEDYQVGLKHPVHVYCLVQTAHDENWLGELLTAALDERPKEARLTTLMTELGGGAKLEAAVAGSALVDPLRFEEIFRWMVQIRVGNLNASGILIAPDLVLTNGHVWTQILANGGIQAAAAVFDHRSLNAVEVSSGRTVGFDVGWVPLHRPYNPKEGMPDQTEPTDEELDYAILRLVEKVGQQPPGDPTKAAGDALPRGWLRLQNPDPAVAPLPTLPAVGSPLIVFQHPRLKSGQVSLQWALGQALPSPWPARRFRYSATTLGGSSGSPCFDQACRFVALHHAADYSVPPQFNQAIPLAAILTDLARQENRFTSQGSVLPWKEALPLQAVVPAPPPEPPPQPLPSPAGSVAEAIVLGKPPRVYFVNRYTLRDHLKGLTERAEDYRIVAVKGEPKSGKKHSRELIEHVAEAWGVNCTYLDVTSPQSLADTCLFIAEQMGFADDALQQMEKRVTLDEADPGRMGWKFASWLAKATSPDKSKFWWLVIDGLAPNKNANPALRDHLAGGLIEGMRTNKLFTQVVLFLIGAEPPVDPYLAGLTVNEHLDTLQTKELRKFFEDYTAAKGKQLRADEVDLLVHTAVGPAQASLSTQQMNALQAGIAKAVKGLKP